MSQLTMATTNYVYSCVTIIFQLGQFRIRSAMIWKYHIYPKHAIKALGKYNVIKIIAHIFKILTELNKTKLKLGALKRVYDELLGSSYQPMVHTPSHPHP